MKNCKKFLKKISFFCFILLGIATYSQKINRIADKGFSYQTDSKAGGVRITDVTDGGPVYEAGLRKDDIIIGVDNSSLDGYEKVNRVLTQLPSHTELTFKILRNGKTKVLKVILPPISKEEYPNTSLEYGGFDFSGESIRTIVTKPKIHPMKRLPAVMLVPWLSCGSIDIPGEAADGMDYIIKSFANNPNIIFYRVEKNGVGDSRGTACIDLDAKTEIDTYIQALKVLKNRSDVDVDQIYLLGLSLGTSLAPLIGKNENIKGYMVSGGTTITWFEHMLQFERNRLTLSGMAPKNINTAMNSFADFYQQYLIEKKTPEEIINENPEYRELWYDDPRHQFGRSATYYQQIQELNFEEAWDKVNVPVLAVYGEYDWVMSLNDHQRLVYLVNDGKNLAQLEVLPKTSHLLSSFPTLKDAFEDEIGEINPAGYNLMWRWLANKINPKQ